MSPTGDETARPLLTIGVKCHNQVKTIGAAVAAALAQTYRPLEVVVVDDGSTDGSWEEIRRSAAKSGDLKVILRRNERNLGNLGNWMRVCALSHGEWVVKADGDDISLPARVERIAAAVSANPDATVLMHGAYRIGGSGEVAGVLHPRSVRAPLGAVMAFSRRCYEDFPKEVADGRVMDDEVFSRRALMIGTAVLLDEPLVRYRCGGISSNETDIKGSELRCTRLLPGALAQSRLDLASQRGRLGANAAQAFARELDRDGAEAGLRIALMSNSSFVSRWRAWRTMRRPPVMTPGYLKYFLYLLPSVIGNPFLRLLSAVRQLGRAHSVRNVAGWEA